jgi:hypothetical protein
MIRTGRERTLGLTQSRSEFAAASPAADFLNQPKIAFAAAWDTDRKVTMFLAITRQHNARACRAAYSRLSRGRCRLFRNVVFALERGEY